jgi:serine protease AprX
VITVGAADLNGTIGRSDDVAAPWSAWGRTPTGFMKPDLVAPGRYIVGPVPSGSTLAAERADKLVSPGYIQLSGTSFAAPVVSGAAAQVLARHPYFTPDQVKGALMVSATPLPAAVPGSVGVGEVQVTDARRVWSPPNPNLGLDAFVKPVAGSTAPVFDAVSWSDVAKANVSWDDVSWDDVSWADAAWNVVSWADVSWADVSWADVSWADVSWADVSWADVSWEDAAEGDSSSDPSLYLLEPSDVNALMSDPDLAPSSDALPASVLSAAS